MTNSIYIIITAILAAPFLGVLVDRLFSRRTEKVKLKNSNIVGEKSAFDLYKEVLVLLDDKDKKLSALSDKFDELSEKFDSLKKDSDQKDIEKEQLAKTAERLTEENMIKDIRISDLEERVKTLEEELASYKLSDSIVDTTIQTSILK